MYCVQKPLLSCSTNWKAIILIVIMEHGGVHSLYWFMQRLAKLTRPRVEIYLQHTCLQRLKAIGWNTVDSPIKVILVPDCQWKVLSSCRSIFVGAFLLQVQISLSPGMVSNDDTSLCDKSVVGEELFCSDFAIMCISHIAYLCVCVCVCARARTHACVHVCEREREIKQCSSLLLSVLKQFLKMKCGSLLVWLL